MVRLVTSQMLINLIALWRRVECLHRCKAMRLLEWRISALTFIFH